jgi:hypothetical protein
MEKKNYNKNLPSEREIEKFEILYPMLTSIHNEMQDFAKKKQDGVLNELKVKLINNLLNDIKEILKTEESSKYLNLLDNDTLPQNSDAVIIISQYLSSMHVFRNKYYRYDNRVAEHRWFTREEPGKPEYD